MTDDIPMWAKERACKLINEHAAKRYAGPWSVTHLERVADDTLPPFARYIATKEQPPVDPLEAEADRLYTDWLDGMGGCREVILAALRRGMELAK